MDRTITNSPPVRQVVEEVMALPYVWPAGSDADWARRAGAGSCSSKHALLADRLAALGVPSRPLFVVGSLVPQVLEDDPRFHDGRHLLEVHECLTVSLTDVGPLTVDVTWDPPLIERGLPGTLQWDGRSDMQIAVGMALAAWAPDPALARQEKEAIRTRLYGPDERTLRDRILAGLSSEFESWRGHSRQQP